MLSNRAARVLVVMMALTSGKFARAQTPATFEPSKWTGIFGFHIGTPDRFSAVLGIGKVVSEWDFSFARTGPPANGS